MPEEICEKCGLDHEGRCAAHRKRHAPDEPFAPCGNYKALGTNVCRMHGAKSASGAKSGTFKTGRFSTCLPQGWARSAQEMAADPDLLELREHIALVDELIRQELLKLTDPDSPTIGLRAAKAAILRLDKATAERQGQKAQEAYQELKTAVLQIDREDRSRAELHRLLDQRRKFVDTEYRRTNIMKSFVTPEQLTVLAYRFVDLSAQMMERFSERMARLFAERAGHVRELVVGRFLAFGVPVPRETVDRVIGRSLKGLEIGHEIESESSSALADFAAQIQEIGEDSGASDVDEDELAN